MPSRIFTFAILLSFFTCLQTATAEFVITLTTQGTGVMVTIEGTGTVVPGGSGIGTVLNFDDFSGMPFTAGISGTGDGQIFDLATDMMITGNDASTGNSYTAMIDCIRFDNDGSGSSDVDFFSDFDFAPDDTYTASASAMIDGLSAADLELGTYLSTTADSRNFNGEFGPLQMDIIAGVPEPTSLMSFGVAMGAFLLRRRRRSRSTG